MNEQIIVTAAGERLVVIPEADFIAMRDALEDRRDVEIVENFRRKLAAGEEELIPADVVARVLNGESKVRVWREYRGLSARDLALTAQISTGYLSQLETGARDGSIETFRRIAAALGVSIDDLA